VKIHSNVADQRPSSIPMMRSGATRDAEEKPLADAIEEGGKRRRRHRRGLRMGGDKGWASCVTVEVIRCSGGGLVLIWLVTRLMVK